MGHRNRTERRFWRACTILAVSCFWLPACERTDGPQRDVLLITVDALRAANVGLYGYSRDTTPNLDRWFADALVFERAYTTHASTSASIASMLSGRLPQEHGVRLHFQLIPGEVEIIPDLLPGEYTSAAFVSNAVLTDAAMGLAARFDHFDDTLDRREPGRPVYERDAKSTTDAVLAWLAEKSDGQSPLFTWVHFIDPHGPYRPPDSWLHHFENYSPRPIDISRVVKYMREPGLTDGNAYAARYDSEIAYLDSEIGRLLKGYQRTRSLEQTLVILTADHGESMMEHEQWFTHSYHVYDEISRIPMLLRAPGVASERANVLVSGIDVAETILRFAGVDKPTGVGRAAADLRVPAEIDRDRIVFTESINRGVQRRAAIHGTRKVIAIVDASGAVRRTWYYDLETDPGEFIERRIDRSDRVAASLLALVARDPDPAGVPATYEKGQIPSPGVAPRATPEDIDRLRQLGYVE